MLWWSVRNEIGNGRREIGRSEERQISSFAVKKKKQTNGIDTGREPGVKGSLIIFLGWEMLWGYADGGGMIT